MASRRPARLTIYFREPISREVAAQIVRRAHAAGMASATIHRGSTARLRKAPIPEPRTVSLADAEGTTIAVIAPEPELARFVASLADLASGAESLVEVDGAVRELHQRDGGALAR